MKTPPDPIKLKLLEAALPHVAFDGWAPSVFDAAVAELELDPDHAKTLCPRGAVDLAIVMHQEGDAAMTRALEAADLDQMKVRERVTFAIRTRLDVIEDKEAVRRGSSLFALPHMAPDGAKLIWGTSDAIWSALGDPSQDVNWYTKRATLSGVYASVVLFWLGDMSLDEEPTNRFIDRRIEDVMRIEKVKAAARSNPLLKPMMGPLGKLGEMIKAPAQMADVNLPGVWRDPT